MRILYAADYFQSRQPDEAFLLEAEAFTAQGFDISTFKMEALAARSERPRPALEGPTLYRGWMLDSDQYAHLVEAIKRGGGEPFTTHEEYLRAHHIPSWAGLLAEHTPETVVLPNGTDFEAEIRALGWGKFFVKDYVKSLKTSLGSILSDPSEVGALVAEMQKYRGTIEGGLCIRRVEDLRPETERRFFVLHGKPYSAEEGAIPPEVEECAERIESPFFSMDAALDTQGRLRIVEIGDGQVSDLVGWSVDRFVSLFADK